LAIIAQAIRSISLASMMVTTFVDRCASNAVSHGQHCGHLGCCGFADCSGVNSIVSSAAWRRASRRLAILNAWCGLAHFRSCEHGGLNSPHIHGTHLPMEGPSTSSMGDIARLWCLNRTWRRWSKTGKAVDDRDHRSRKPCGDQVVFNGSTGFLLQKRTIQNL